MDHRPAPGERLVAVVQELSLARSLSEVQGVVRRAARELTGADGATFVLREGEQCFYADEDAIMPLWKGSRFPMSACVSGWVMTHREAAIIEDVFDDERVPSDAYRPTFVKSMAMVPVRTRDPIGAIGAYWAVHRLPDEGEVAVLQALADCTSTAMENVRLIAELQGRIAERTQALAHARRAEEALRHELEERVQTEDRLRRTEQQLRQAQKMEAVGQLAGGIAHDFNNLLSVILTYTETLLEEIPEGHPNHDDIDEIRKAGERAARLTQQLLVFSRKRVAEPTLLDVNFVVSCLERMVRRILGADVQLEVAYGGGLYPVVADAGSLDQVFMNLVVNARDAMPDGGRLTIETTNVTLGDEYASTHLGVAGGEYVLIAVSDTGVGMDREVQGRVFEPFFTTKTRGKGTGLGLSVVYGIVKQAGGNVWVYSEPGHGTTFKVYLPRAPRDSAARPAPAEAPSSMAVELGESDDLHAETVLLVEDDEQVRTAAVSVLRRAGYCVIEAENGAAALACLDAHDGPVDLLLTDLVMPRMNGMELARRIRLVSPTTRVLCMSGYSDEAVVRHGFIDFGMNFLQKPFTPERLLQRVRQVVESDDAR